jgi:hypothetical protein
MTQAHSAGVMTQAHSAGMTQAHSLTTPHSR